MKSLTEAQLLQIQQEAYELGHAHALDQVELYNSGCYKQQVLDLQKEQTQEAKTAFIKTVSEV